MTYSFLMAHSVQVMEVVRGSRFLSVRLFIVLFGETD